MKYGTKDIIGVFISGVMLGVVIGIFLFAYLSER
jgi:F0F1-type ATP synthase assembly protein I